MKSLLVAKVLVQIAKDDVEHGEEDQDADAQQYKPVLSVHAFYICNQFTTSSHVSIPKLLRLLVYAHCLVGLSGEIHFRSYRQVFSLFALSHCCS